MIKTMINSCSGLISQYYRSAYNTYLSIFIEFKDNMLRTKDEYTQVE